jgi:periplasmic protein TonB
MADILMIGLPETAEHERALAALFARAGLSVAHGQASPAELRDLAAIILLWGDDAARTPPMMDAIDRATATGKALIARLGPRPLPLNLRGPPSFDLTGWRGDPDDPLLDKLLLALDDKLQRRARAPQGPPQPPAPLQPRRMEAAPLPPPPPPPPPPPARPFEPAVTAPIPIDPPRAPKYAPPPRRRPPVFAQALAIIALAGLTGFTVWMFSQPQNPKAPDEQAAITAPTAPDPLGVIAPVAWDKAPTPRELVRLYPAEGDGAKGLVRLRCTVLADFSAFCSVVEETPSGRGFGDAAVKASERLRAAPTLPNGESSVGAVGDALVVLDPPK